MSSMMRLGSAAADQAPEVLGQYGAFARGAADVMRHGQPTLEHYPPPHFGTAPGGYAPKFPKTRQELIDEEWLDIDRQILEYQQDLWWNRVRGPTAGVLPGLPAGGGMAVPFTGV